MRAHIVLAHPEPQSFNGHLAQEARSALEAAGWQVSQTDLYAGGFDPCEGPQHYRDRVDPARFDAQREQRHASDADALPAFVVEELQRLDAADLLILQYPMWWHMPPAILKGWFDRVFAYGDVYTARRRFETGRFATRRALLSVTVGTSPATYEHNGRSGDISLMLWPVEFTLAYVGYEILAPFVAYGVEGGLRYSDPAAIDARLKAIVESLRSDLRSLDERPKVPFNRMSDWGADGRILPEAPVHSPYVRHKREMDLG
jgi:NAD(P)H dehydrogenase (quinone)